MCSTRLKSVKCDVTLPEDGDVSVSGCDEQSDERRTREVSCEDNLAGRQWTHCRCGPRPYRSTIDAIGQSAIGGARLTEWPLYSTVWMRPLCDRGGRSGKRTAASARVGPGELLRLMAWRRWHDVCGLCTRHGSRRRPTVQLFPAVYFCVIQTMSDTSRKLSSLCALFLYSTGLSIIAKRGPSVLRDAG